MELTDIYGKTYIDMMASHTRANTLGYGNKEIARAVYEQLATLHHIGTNNNLGEPTIRLATKLAELAPGRLSKTMFVSGGSEAVETALKLAKQYHVNRGAKPRANKIISRWFAYHGATMGALGASDWLGVRHISEPGVPGYSFIPAPTCYRNPFGIDDEAYGEFCAQYLEQQIVSTKGPNTWPPSSPSPSCRRMVCRSHHPATCRECRKFAAKYEVLFIVDEIITGFGRAGEWFASIHFGIEPDIMTSAKALTAGYIPDGRCDHEARDCRRPAYLPPRAHLQRPSGGGGRRECHHRRLANAKILSPAPKKTGPIFSMP